MIMYGRAKQMMPPRHGGIDNLLLIIGQSVCHGGGATRSVQASDSELSPRSQREPRPRQATIARSATILNAPRYNKKTINVSHSDTDGRQQPCYLFVFVDKVYSF